VVANLKRFINKRGFTTLELVFIIAIISILSTIVIRNSDNSLLVARDQLIQHIRYAQDLAMFDNKYRSKPVSSSAEDFSETKFWFKSMWQLKIGTTADTIFYAIYSDSSTNSTTTNFNRTIHKKELAVDFETKRLLVGAWKGFGSTYSGIKEEEAIPKLNLTRFYGIEKVESNLTFGKWDKNQITFSFDNFGRPYYFYKSGTNGALHPFEYLLKEEVQIKLSKNGDIVCFNIEPISGYISIESCIF
jgi:Tfp pilus assembly protein FimT